MEIATVARPYAEALFQIAQKQDLLHWSQLIEALANIASHPQVIEVASNPTLRKDQIANVLFQIFHCENRKRAGISVCADFFNFFTSNLLII